MGGALIATRLATRRWTSLDDHAGFGAGAGGGGKPTLLDGRGSGSALPGLPTPPFVGGGSLAPLGGAFTVCLTIGITPSSNIGRADLAHRLALAP
jgi:hypothetical protein